EALERDSINSMRLVKRQIKRFRRVVRLLPTIIKMGNGLLNTCLRTLIVFKNEGLDGIGRRIDSADLMVALPEFAYDPEKVVRMITGTGANPSVCVANSHIAPDVSIVIPCFGKVIYTLNCIKSLVTHSSKYSFEIIVVDDCSQDNTAGLMSRLDFLNNIRNKRNLGFIGSCNAGASSAKGKYLVFLNNDTIVLPGWLDELYDTFVNFPNAGLVGSKLLYSDGRLQEAGCIIWNDGSASNYGRRDDQNKPEYNYARQVDYCSGASIMIRRELFNELGQFDEAYAPAYAEDADLAFKVRVAGRQVWYQPLSSLIHFEGISCGKDGESGVKSYQSENLGKLFQNWRDDISLLNEPGDDVVLARDHGVRARVLFIDHLTPEPDKDAGSVFTVNFIHLFTQLGVKIDFVSFYDPSHMGSYTHFLERLGVQCLYHPYFEDVKSHLQRFGDIYDLCVVCRAPVAASCFDLIKTYAPQAKIIFDTIDLNFLREMREADLKNSKELLLQALATKEIETRIIREADITLLHSEEEKKILAEEGLVDGIETFLWITDIACANASPQNRTNIMFLGGFQHPPNIDAVTFFVAEWFPLIREYLPGVKLLVVGSRPTEDVLKLASEDVQVLGYVKELGPVFQDVRVFVSPLRYGAGIKGKVIESLRHGVPCVATSVSVEGSGLNRGDGVIVEDDPHKFALAVRRLYTDDEDWTKLSRGGISWVTQNFSHELGLNKLKNVLHSIGIRIS
ncbi:MAG: glycosyltransferase, partial [Desulfomonile sp.]